MTTKAMKVNRSTKPEFSSSQQKELDTLREYVTGLRELIASLNTELPGDKKVAQKAQFEIDLAADKIADLEIQKIKAGLSGELPR